MAITIDYSTFVITIPQSDMTFLGGSIYELDIDVFRLALKTLEASDEGMPFPDTHFHNTEVTISGTTFARAVGILSPYTVTISPAAAYQVSCKGANHNIQDVLNNLTGPTFLPNNSAGLVNNTAPPTADEVADEVHSRGKLANQIVLQRGEDFDIEVP